jgi:hypothetical protein
MIIVTFRTVLWADPAGFTMADPHFGGGDNMSWSTKSNGEYFKETQNGNWTHIPGT